MSKVCIHFFGPLCIFLLVLRILGISGDDTLCTIPVFSLVSNVDRWKSFTLEMCSNVFHSSY